jgi:hypothetical protein
MSAQAPSVGYGTNIFKPAIIPQSHVLEEKDNEISLEEMIEALSMNG